MKAAHRLRLVVTDHHDVDGNERAIRVVDSSLEGQRERFDKLARE